MPNRCPLKSPLLRTRALIVFEALRLILVLAIISWWGWLLVDKTRYILSLEGELSRQDAYYIPAMDDKQVLLMVTSEAVALVVLVLASSLFSFWLAVRDIRRTRALQSFFASMAHELRTPLASIRLQTEGIRQQAMGNERQEKYLERLTEDLSRFEMQLDRGLELARSESGKTLTPTAVDLAEIWRRAAPCPILAVTGVPTGKVLADAHALQIIFRNIVENAQIHGKATALKITTEFLYSHRARRGGESRGGERREGEYPPQIKIIFTDNGIGCAEKKKLGHLFFKGASSKGTGVGLYLMQALMKQMGGSASFASGEGFTVTLVFQGITEQGDARSVGDGGRIPPQKRGANA